MPERTPDEPAARDRCRTTEALEIALLAAGGLAAVATAGALL